MASAGFNVPRGFLVTTSAYRSFVSDNGLQPRIIQLARPSVVENRVSFDEASDNLEALFAASDLAPNVVEEVISAYRALGDALPVAVRSSANAEDLPDLSFAGQQETYLNVRGADQVVAAVQACWASLWTARAINYRHQNGIDQNGVAMAVVVQVMVPSAVSGILFTANPATGERAEMIVNASFGLGEAVVSGEVTPDTYIIDRATGRPKETIIGPKEQKTVSAGNQGTRRELREARKRHHPPGTIPAEASNIPSVRFKETQIRNDEASDTLNGFAVSSGTVTARASVVLSQTDFDRMSPGTILVARNTTPAWTQLFSHAVGVVTDMGSILAHASIVAREYGIPAVLGVGNGTLRIHHGQMLTIDGDAGTVLIHEAT